jgi:hypothetical protein
MKGGFSEFELPHHLAAVSNDNKAIDGQSLAPQESVVRA